MAKHKAPPKPAPKRAAAARTTPKPKSKVAKPAATGARAEPAGRAEPAADSRQLLREAAWRQMFGAASTRNPFDR